MSDDQASRIGLQRPCVDKCVAVTLSTGESKTDALLIFAFAFQGGGTYIYDTWIRFRSLAASQCARQSSSSHKYLSRHLSTHYWYLRVRPIDKSRYIIPKCPGNRATRLTISYSLNHVIHDLLSKTTHLATTTMIYSRLQLQRHQDQDINSLMDQ
jgi:hypothetical protein